MCVHRYYMYLPLEKQKPCINLISQWEDRTYRLYNSNMLEDIVVQFVCAKAKHFFTIDKHCQCKPLYDHFYIATFQHAIFFLFRRRAWTLSLSFKGSLIQGQSFSSELSSGNFLWMPGICYFCLLYSPKASLHKWCSVTVCV